jgi:hypothetical protein
MVQFSRFLWRREYPSGYVKVGAVFFIETNTGFTFLNQASVFGLSVDALDGTGLSEGYVNGLTLHFLRANHAAVKQAAPLRIELFHHFLAITNRFAARSARNKGKSGN